MAYLFNGFRATKPVERLIDSVQGFYEVFFVVYDSNDKKHFKRFKKGINQFPTKLKRMQEAKAMAEVLWEALQNKWNPLQQKVPQFGKPVDEIKHVLFADGLDLAVAAKRAVLSKYSMYDYDGCVRFMKAAAKTTGHYYARLNDLDRLHIKEILNQARVKNKWSANARNKYLAIFRSLLSVLVDDLEVMKFNPAKGIKDEQADETLGYKTVTDKEKTAIADHLILRSHEFFEYCMFIYDDGIRRKETLLLQIQDFNLTTREIRIRAEVAKTNRERIVPITDTILQILLRREIWTYPPTYYLFSSDKFRPGPDHYHPNTPTGWWKEMVIDKKTGLGIDCKMYSLKHKGADDKILSDIPLDALKNLYGHKSKKMTEGYARAIQGKYKQQIIDKAPAFAKVVEMHRKAQ